MFISEIREAISKKYNNVGLSEQLQIEERVRVRK